MYTFKLFCFKFHNLDYIIGVVKRMCFIIALAASPLMLYKKIIIYSQEKIVLYGLSAFQKK